MTKKQGKLFLIAGPSGVGKKTLIQKIHENFQDHFVESVSLTTRERRENEIEGKDYFFVSKEYFKNEIEKNNLIEYAFFFQNYYGTPKKFIFENLNRGKNIILEIEVIGFEQIIKKIPNIVTIFILPPSIDELKNRLIKRKESLNTINERIEKSKEELTESKKFKYKICNNNIMECFEKLKKIIISEIS